MFVSSSCPGNGLQNGLAMCGAPSESVVYFAWHMCGSFVLLRGLDAVVAAEAAEETGDAFAVPFEAAVAFVFGSTAAVGAGAVAIVLEDRLESSESSGCSAEKSPAERVLSIKHGVEATIVWTMDAY